MVIIYLVSFPQKKLVRLLANDCLYQDQQFHLKIILKSKGTIYSHDATTEPSLVTFKQMGNKILSR